MFNKRLIIFISILAIILGNLNCKKEEQETYGRKLLRYNCTREFEYINNFISILEEDVQKRPDLGGITLTLTEFSCFHSGIWATAALSSGQRAFHFFWEVGKEQDVLSFFDDRLRRGFSGIVHDTDVCECTAPIPGCIQD